MSKKIYDDDMLRSINDSVNLLEYVSQSISMEKRGGDYFGRCPLHIDKTPSFSGGIIGYLIDYEKMSFDDAVEKASKLANIDMSRMCQSETITFLKKVRNANNKQKRIFQHPILDEIEYSKYEKKPVPEWINEGIHSDIIDLFDIRIDNNQNRIVYPVRNIKGQLINVKARTRYKNYKEMKIPKYINYYPIGVMDYFQSLDISLPYIKEKGEVIIFESIKSTMKAYGWGFKNCVSAEKHTLTPEQISLLLKLNVNVVLAFDSDVSYYQKDVKRDVDILRRTTNTFLIEDRKELLGGASAKNAPVDKGEEIWNELYVTRRKVV